MIGFESPPLTGTMQSYLLSGLLYEFASSSCSFDLSSQLIKSISWCTKRLEQTPFSSNVMLKECSEEYRHSVRNLIVIVYSTFRIGLSLH